VRIDVALAIASRHEIGLALLGVGIAVRVEREPGHIALALRFRRDRGNGRRRCRPAACLHQQAGFARRLAFGCGLLARRLRRLLGRRVLLRRGFGRHRLLMLEDRAAEIAGQRRPQLRHLAIAGRKCVQRVARRLGRLAAIALLADQMEAPRLEREPGGSNEHRCGDRHQSNDQTALEADSRCRAGSQDEGFRIDLGRCAGLAGYGSIGHHDLLPLEPVRLIRTTC
jgi:hypothetical protein